MSISKIQKGALLPETPQNHPLPGGRNTDPGELLVTLREKRALLAQLVAGNQHEGLAQKLDQTIADLETLLSQLEEK